MSRFTLLFWQLMVAVVALSLWQFFATVPVFGRMILPPFFFSNPVDVFSQIVKWFMSGVIWKHLAITLWESILAFVIGSVGGVLVGFWFARQPLVAAVFDPYVKMVNALPRPRDISEVRMEKEFHALHREIWSVLKDEVMKGYAQSTLSAEVG